jgi:hypothetical protein
LQATDRFEEFGPAEAEKVFRMIAPVLAPGKPLYIEPPTADDWVYVPFHLVFEDPAETVSR